MKSIGEVLQDQLWLGQFVEPWLERDFAEDGAYVSIARIRLSNGRKVEVIYCPKRGGEGWIIYHVTNKDTLLRMAAGPDLHLQFHNAKAAFESNLATPGLDGRDLRYI
jgi:hypothetical protein